MFATGWKTLKPYLRLTKETLKGTDTNSVNDFFVMESDEALRSQGIER